MPLFPISQEVYYHGYVMSFMNIVAGVFHPRSIFMLDLPSQRSKLRGMNPTGIKSYLKRLQTLGWEPEPVTISA